MRSFSLRALAAIEGPAAVPLLLERLHADRHARVRVAAVLALEPLADPQIPDALIGRLRDRDPEVRMAAADAVSRLDSEQARQAIRARHRRERHRDVRRVLQQAMKRISQAPAAPAS
jgi:HEAT repeat protein